MVNHPPVFERLASKKEPIFACRPQKGNQTMHGLHTLPAWTPEPFRWEEVLPAAQVEASQGKADTRTQAARENVLR